MGAIKGLGFGQRLCSSPICSPVRSVVNSAHGSTALRYNIVGVIAPKKLKSQVDNILILAGSVIHRVSKKTVPDCFCHNFVNFPPMLIIFGTLIAERINLCDVHLFSISPNSRQRPTVSKCKCSRLLNNAVIISIRLLTFASSIRQKAPRNIIVLLY